MYPGEKPGLANRTLPEQTRRSERVNSELEIPSCLPAHDVASHHPPIHGQVGKSAGDDSEELKGWRQSLACRNVSDTLSWVGSQHLTFTVCSSDRGDQQLGCRPV